MDFMMTWLAAGVPPGGGQSQGSPLQLPVMMAVMLAIFYFMLIRPQQRREKERRALLAQIKSGDRVVFCGGILGLVTNAKEKTFTIKVDEGVKLEVVRSAVTQVLEKGETPEDSPAKK